MIGIGINIAQKQDFAIDFLSKSSDTNLGKQVINRRLHAHSTEQDFSSRTRTNG